MTRSVFAFQLLLILLQASTNTRMSDRQLDGLKGPAKRVFEEWSGPIEGSTFPADFRCRHETRLYDSQGRLTSRSDYPGVRCEEEIKQDYTYDKDGNRHERRDASRASGIPGPPPPTESADAVHKQTFESDDQGWKTSVSTYSSDGALLYVTAYVYDAQNRLRERRSLDAAKSMTGKETFTYTDKEPFPTSSTSLGADGKPYSGTTYTDYELNTHGDWIKRKAISERPGGKKSTRLVYRTILYY